MIALGVDLGSQGAVAVVQSDQQRYSLALIQRTRAWPLHRLQAYIEMLITLFGPEVIATERPFSGRHDQYAKRGLSQAAKQAVVRAAAEEWGIRFAEFAPQSIKKALAGHGQASKAQMISTARGLVGLELDEHQADAVCIGIMAINRAVCPVTKINGR